MLKLELILTDENNSVLDDILLEGTIEDIKDLYLKLKSLMLMNTGDEE